MDPRLRDRDRDPGGMKRPPSRSPDGAGPRKLSRQESELQRTPSDTGSPHVLSAVGSVPMRPPGPRLKGQSSPARDNSIEPTRRDSLGSFNKPALLLANPREASAIAAPSLQQEAGYMSATTAMLPQDTTKVLADSAVSQMLSQLSSRIATQASLQLYRDHAEEAFRQATLEVKATEKSFAAFPSLKEKKTANKEAALRAWRSREQYLERHIAAQQPFLDDLEKHLIAPSIQEGLLQAQQNHKLQVVQWQEDSRLSASAIADSKSEIDALHSVNKSLRQDLDQTQASWRVAIENRKNEMRTANISIERLEHELATVKDRLSALERSKGSEDTSARQLPVSLAALPGDLTERLVIVEDNIVQLQTEREANQELLDGTVREGLTKYGQLLRSESQKRDDRVEELALNVETKATAKELSILKEEVHRYQTLLDAKMSKEVYDTFLTSDFVPLRDQISKGVFDVSRIDQELQKLSQDHEAGQAELKRISECLQPHKQRGQASVDDNASSELAGQVGVGSTSASTNGSTIVTLQEFQGLSGYVKARERHLQARIDAVTGAVSHLKQRYDNLTTDEIVRQMVDQMSVMYPYAKDFNRAMQDSRGRLDTMQGVLSTTQARVIAIGKTANDSMTEAKTLRYLIDVNMKGPSEVQQLIQRLDKDIEALGLFDSTRGEPDKAVKSLRGAVEYLSRMSTSSASKVNEHQNQLALIGKQMDEIRKRYSDGQTAVLELRVSCSKISKSLGETLGKLEGIKKFVNEELRH